MDKKIYIVLLFVCVLFALNFSAAHEIDNSTDIANSNLLQVNADQSSLKDASSLTKTNVEVVSNTTFDDCLMRIINQFQKLKLHLHLKMLHIQEALIQTV